MKLGLIDRRSDHAWILPARLQQELERLCAQAGAPEWRVARVLVDDDQMTSHNQQYRQQPTVTDVLSFSYLENEGAEPPRLTAGAAFAARDLWWDRIAEETGAVVGDPGVMNTGEQREERLPNPGQIA